MLNKYAVKRERERERERGGEGERETDRQTDRQIFRYGFLVRSVLIILSMKLCLTKHGTEPKSPKYNFFTNQKVIGIMRKKGHIEDWTQDYGNSNIFLKPLFRNNLDPFVNNANLGAIAHTSNGT